MSNVEILEFVESNPGTTMDNLLKNVLCDVSDIEFLIKEKKLVEIRVNIGRTTKSLLFPQGSVILSPVKTIENNFNEINNEIAKCINGSLLRSEWKKKCINQLKTLINNSEDKTFSMYHANGSRKYSSMKDAEKEIREETPDAIFVYENQRFTVYVTKDDFVNNKPAGCTILTDSDI